MKEEFIDVLDENGIITGDIVTRSQVHKDGLWHRAIIVAIVNEKNQVLLQKRAGNKDKNPNMWDISVAGHISAGQDSLSAAAREINEEVCVMLGYKTEIKDFRYMYSFRKEEVIREDYIERQFYDLFILREFGLDDKTIHFQKEEVQAVKFVDLTEIQQMDENNEIVKRPEVYSVLLKYLYQF